MDTQIEVALITGLFGALVAPFATQVVIPWLKKRRKDSQAERKHAQPLAIYLNAGIGGVIGVILGYFLISQLFVSPCPPFAPTAVEIASPVSGTSVPRLVTVQGTACHIPDDEDLWLFVVPEGITAYYPQQGPVLVTNDGKWTSSVYIGLDDPVDVGRGFVLIAVLANNIGSTAIRQYFSQASTSGQVGLEPLPSGIKLLTQVQVIRK